MTQAGVVYRVYDAEGTLLYVGCSFSPLQRLLSHKYEQPWWSLIARVEFEHIEGRAETFLAERRAISTENPLFNQQSNTTTEAAA